MTNNPIFSRVKNTFIKKIEKESDQDTLHPAPEYWTEILGELEEVETPEELIQFLIDELHTDPEDAALELYQVMASILEKMDYHNEN